ncbi:MAG: ABC transporter substrate-binding protein, partial [Acidimicrobiia bacterium]
MRKLLLPLLVAVAALAAACGGDSDRTGVAAAPAGSTADGGPLEVADNTGGTVTLDGPARRVVVLEWDFAEHLLAVGVAPVGVADVEGYRDWLVSELPADVTDVGTRQEPNLERIAALDPDLIVGVDFRHEEARDSYEAIAPTLVFRDYPEPGKGSELELMQVAVRALGRAVGRPDEARAALDDLDRHLEEAAARVESAGRAGTKVAVAQGYSSEGNPEIRMFTDNARIMELLSRVGLDNGWEGPAEQYGFNTVDVEGLTTLPADVVFLYIAQDDDNVFTGTYATNPVWQSMGFV